jgi:hypothetical protein
MMTAEGYGNAGAYFHNSPNTQSAFYLSLVGGFAGKRPGSAYSVVRQEGVAISITGRRNAASSAVAGRQGMRAVAFPLSVGWNWDTPGT